MGFYSLLVLRLLALVLLHGGFLLAGLEVERPDENALSRRKDQVTVKVGAATTLVNQYGFDGVGRIGSVTRNPGSAPYSATYAYVPGSDLLYTTTSANGGTTRLAATRQWDFGYRLREVDHLAGGLRVSRHVYGYDSRDRRQTATLAMGRSGPTAITTVTRSRAAIVVVVCQRPSDGALLAQPSPVKVLD